MKKMDNKGFSLVELIIVIAIMAILVGVLAPQFMKYVEQSRRSSDISSAEEIRQAVIASIADGEISGSNTTVSHAFDDAMVSQVSSISKKPTIRGNVVDADEFTVVYNCGNGTCDVKAGDYVLTNEAGASEYKTFSGATN